MTIIRYFAAGLIAAHCLAPDTAAAQAGIKTYHGSWTVRCNIGGRQPDLCGTVSKKYSSVRRARDFMRIRIKIIRVRGRFFFQVDVPTDFDEAQGIRLELDGQLVSKLPTRHCVRQFIADGRIIPIRECTLEIPFTASLRKRFSGSKTVSVKFSSKGAPRFDLTVPLDGLSDALAALEKR